MPFINRLSIVFIKSKYEKKDWHKLNFASNVIIYLLILIFTIHLYWILYERIFDSRTSAGFIVGVGNIGASQGL